MTSRNRRSRVQSQFYPFTGGVNLVDPQLRIPPGQLIAAKNYEGGVRGGYRRDDGYERFSGQLSPSEASYWVLNFTSGGPAAFTVGQILGNASPVSTISGEVLFPPVVIDESQWAVNNATGSVILGRVEGKQGPGNFAHGNSLYIPPSGTVRATVNGYAAERGASTLELDQEYYAAAIETLRNDIGTPPGSGPIRGVAVYNGDVYCWRDAVSGTAGVMFKATTSGWTVVNLGGATLSPGGTYRYDVYNFLGSAGTEKLYFVNGLDKGHQYDGTTITVITTGMTVDKPTYVKGHEKHLFLFFPGGSIQNSGIGDPLTWTPVTGASEIATGGEVTGVQALPGGPLLVLNRNEVYILHGTSTAGSDPWRLQRHHDTTGGIENTLQRLGDTIYLDDRGLTALRDVDSFGNYSDATFSQNVQPKLMTQLDKVVTSLIARCKNQYRIYFDEAAFADAPTTGYHITFDDRQVVTIMPVELAHRMTCATSEENSAGVEIMFFGAEDGYVYQLDKGTSFDGLSIQAYIRPAFNHLGSPHLRKKIRGIEVETISEDDPTGTVSTATVDHVPSFSYEDGDAAEHRVDASIIAKTSTTSALSVTGMRFNGGAGYLHRSTGMVGSADGKQVLISFWIIPRGPRAVGSQTIFRCGTAFPPGEFAVYIDQDFKISVDGRAVDASTIVFAITASGGIPDDGKYHHVLISADLSVPTGYYYLDGESKAAVVTLFNQLLDLTHDDWAIARSGPSFPETALQGTVAEFYMALEYLPPTQATIDKFNEDGDPPPNLGLDGSSPTGTQPLIYLSGQVGSGFEDNAGSGGAFTVQGAPEVDALDVVPEDVTRPRINMDAKGDGQNFSATMYSRKTYEEPHTVYGATVYYSERRRKRGLGA